MRQRPNALRVLQFVTGVGQVLMPDQANGSLEKSADGSIINSWLIGQQWRDPQWFHGRPSTTTNLSDPTKASPYNAANATASSLGPTSKFLQERLIGARKSLDQAQPEQTAALVEQRIAPRSVGTFGEPRVNVLELSLGLQTTFPKRQRRGTFDRETS